MVSSEKILVKNNISSILENVKRYCLFKMYNLDGQKLK